MAAPGNSYFCHQHCCPPREVGSSDGKGWNRPWEAGVRNVAEKGRDSRDTVQHVHCTLLYTVMYSIQCTVYSCVQCTVYCVQCTAVYRVQCTVLYSYKKGDMLRRLPGVLGSRGHHSEPEQLSAWGIGFTGLAESQNQDGWKAPSQSKTV